jgi:hypothetical protein
MYKKEIQVNTITMKELRMTLSWVYVRPAWAQSSGLKSLVCPSSGKDIAEHQGCPS